MVKLLTVESQSNVNVFNLIGDLYSIFNIDDWVKEYIFWELKLLEIVGFNLQLNKIAKSEIINNEKKYFVGSSSQKKYVSKFFN